MVRKKKTLSKRVGWQFYDSNNNQCVTLSDLRQMIADGIDVEIVDEKSGDDITVECLLYIIVEKENSEKSSIKTVLVA